MADGGLDGFIAACRGIAEANAEPADCVLAAISLMRGLVTGDLGFLEPRHFRPHPDRYARNAVHVAGDGGLSLFSLVWQPGQWTPVHDHGTWGVVGIVEGVLEERSFMRADHDDTRDTGIALLRGGIVLLAEGSVTTFVPNPDHIHRTGVPADRGRAVSLHLYGRTMDSFHVYDVAAGTRRLIDVAYDDTGEPKDGLA